VKTPARDDLAGAYGRGVPDLVGPGMRVLLVGINPSLWSGWSGFHFGRPSNRLWATLHEAGLTDRRLRPEETDALLAAGIGITNLVNRATARADELDQAEIRAGVVRLRALVRRWRPQHVAVLGVTAYRIAFGQPRAAVGLQPEPFEGARIWVLPNPSGLNAHYQQAELIVAYAELPAALDA
jgi:TDG/mug DNA glycosylase family protein